LQPDSYNEATINLVDSADEYTAKLKANSPSNGSGCGREGNITAKRLKTPEKPPEYTTPRLSANVPSGRTIIYRVCRVDINQVVTTG